MKDLLGFCDELVGFVPVFQQISGLLVVNSDVVVFKHPWEKVVYFSGHVQDVAHSVGSTGKDRLNNILKLNHHYLLLLLLIKLHL